MGKKIVEGMTGIVLILIVAVLAIGAHARNGLWRNEIDFWRDCVRKAPQKERTHHNLGYALYEEGKLDEARKAFEEALTLNPRYALSWYNLGLVFYQKGMIEDAIACYKKALSREDHPPETSFNLGLAYYQKGCYLESVEALQTFAEIRPDYMHLYNHLGRGYHRLNQWEQAIESFREEERRHPLNPYSHLYLGDLHRERKETAKALASYQKALSFPEFAEAERVKGIIASLAGKTVPSKGGERKAEGDPES